MPGNRSALFNLELKNIFENVLCKNYWIHLTKATLDRNQYSEWLISRTNIGPDTPSIHSSFFPTAKKKLFPLSWESRLDTRKKRQFEGISNFYYFFRSKKIFRKKLLIPLLSSSVYVICGCPKNGEFWYYFIAFYERLLVAIIVKI